MSPVRVLLLEDDVQLRNALGQVLELEGYQVVMASDGADAVQKSINFPFELLIFDVKLPGPDGLEVLERFKEGNPDLPSIVITGYASEADALRALRLGVGEYLEKPFDSQTLVAAVKRLEPQVFKQREMTNKEHQLVLCVICSLSLLLAKCTAKVSPQDLASTAYRAARSKGFTEDEALELKGAVLLCMARRHLEGDQLEELSAFIPESVQHLGDILEEEAESQGGLAELGRLCLSLPFEPEAESRLESLLGSAKFASDWKEQQCQHLLSLGRHLEATGDLKGARVAFEEVERNASPSERGRALLELSRISFLAGDSGEARALLGQLMRLVTDLGPQAALELELAAAHLSLAQELEEGKALLRRGLKRSQRLGGMSLRKQLELSLAILESAENIDGLITECLQLNQLPFLNKSATWLLPRMASYSHRGNGLHGPMRALARRISHASPLMVGQLLKTHREEDSLLAILQLLQDGGLSQQKRNLEKIASSNLKACAPLAKRILSETIQGDQELRVSVLGVTEIRLADTLLERELWRTSRSRHLLAYLAMNQGNWLPQDQLVEKFWPGASPKRGKRNLTQTSTDLRAALKKSGYLEYENLILRQQSSLTLNPKLSLWLDYREFQDRLTEAEKVLEAGETKKALVLLREAVGLVRGEFLQDCSQEWCEPTRREVERACLQTLEKLAHCCQALKLHPEVEEVCRQLLSRDSCHQLAHGILMESLVAQGRPEQALRHFDKAKAILINELGIEPHTDLIKVYHVARMAL